MANLAAYHQTVVIAEFARRRQARVRGGEGRGRAGRLPATGSSPARNWPWSWSTTGAYAGARIDTAVELTARLPRTLAGDGGRARSTWPGPRRSRSRTRAMTNAGAAYADEVLAAAARGCGRTSWPGRPPR